MPQVFDQTTKLPVNVSAAEAQAGLVSGKFGLDATAKAVPLKGADGKIYSVSPDKVAQVLADHPESYSLLSDDEALKHSVAKEEAGKGFLGSVESGAESAANQATFGALDEARKRFFETPEETARREAANDYHKAARVLGGAVGVGASMLYGGEVFKGIDLAGQAVEHGLVPAAAAADAALATRAAWSAVNFATQGALYASPQALVQAVAGDPKQAAETLLWGIGPGAILGAGSELLGSGVKAGKDALIEKVLGTSKEDMTPAREALNSFADNRTLKNIGAERTQLNKLGKDRVTELADYAHEAGIFDPKTEGSMLSRQELGDRIEAAHQTAGKQLGDTINRLDEIIAKGTKDTDLLDKAIKPGQIGDAIQSALDVPELHMPMNADQKNALDMVVQSANMIPTTKINGQDVVTFEDAQNFVSALRKKWAGAINKDINDGGVKGLQTVTALDVMKSNAYLAAKNNLHAAADAAAVAANDTPLIGALTKSKLDYANLSQLEQFAATLDRQDAGNRMAGLTDFLHMGKGIASGATTAVGSGIGAAIGGWPGAVVGGKIGGYVGIPLDFLAKKWVEERGMVALSHYAKQAANDGPEMFSAVMLSEGGKRITATMKRVGSAIQSMALRAPLSFKPDEYGSPLQHLLGSTAGLTEDQAHSKLADRLNTLTSNPAAMANVVGKLSAPFASVSQPLADAYAQKMAETIQYLHSSLPKPSTPPVLFQPDFWQPSPKDKQAWNDKLEIVANPMNIVARLHNGTISKAHVEALQTIYPSIYGLMQNEIVSFAAKHPDVMMRNGQRSSVATFMGSSTDPIYHTISALQDNNYGEKQQGGGGSSAPNQGGSASMKNMPDLSTTFGNTTGSGNNDT